jgi:hypothetical protein
MRAALVLEGLLTQDGGRLRLGDFTLEEELRDLLALSDLDDQLRPCRFVRLTVEPVAPPDEAPRLS